METHGVVSTFSSLVIILQIARFVLLIEMDYLNGIGKLKGIYDGKKDLYDCKLKQIFVICVLIWSNLHIPRFYSLKKYIRLKMDSI